MLSREQITRKNFCTCSVQMNFLKKYFQSEVLWNYRQKAGCLWATERVIGTSDTLTTITFKFQNLNSSRLKWQYSRSFHFVFCKSHNWKSSYRAKDLHLLMRKTKGRRGLGARGTGWSPSAAANGIIHASLHFCQSTAAATFTGFTDEAD